MMFCHMHNYWYQGAKCSKCLAREKPYLYSRDEVADPDEWAVLERKGWVR